jgi:hypothetical protein
LGWIENARNRNSRDGTINGQKEAQNHTLKTVIRRRFVKFESQKSNTEDDG